VAVGVWVRRAHEEGGGDGCGGSEMGRATRSRLAKGQNHGARNIYEPGIFLFTSYSLGVGVEIARRRPPACAP
jgi:hypothetical protein